MGETKAQAFFLPRIAGGTAIRMGG